MTTPKSKRTQIESEINLEKIMSTIEEMEAIGEQIVIDRRDIIEVDRQRNKNREALRGLIKDETQEKVWLCFGNMFIKTQKETAKKIINEDQQDLNKRIDELRNGLNEKVNALRKLEGKSDLKGFDLKSLSRNEIEALKDILPKVV